MEQVTETLGSSRLPAWLSSACRALIEGRKQRALARALAELDARTLRDIGFPAHAEEQQRRALIRASAFRIGLC